VLRSAAAAVPRAPLLVEVRVASQLVGVVAIRHHRRRRRCRCRCRLRFRFRFRLRLRCRFRLALILSRIQWQSRVAWCRWILRGAPGAASQPVHKARLQAAFCCSAWQEQMQEQMQGQMQE
jgi:hypothetical protein